LSLGNAFAGMYYSLQRLLKARICDLKLLILGWQLPIVAAINFAYGLQYSKEYVELGMAIDIAITFIW
jgi:cbb3-type cytochrome oxidase subunit 1